MPSSLLIAAASVLTSAGAARDSTPRELLECPSSTPRVQHTCARTRTRTPLRSVAHACIGFGCESRTQWRAEDLALRLSLSLVM